jgi:hypothetical protein
MSMANKRKMDNPTIRVAKTFSAEKDVVTLSSGYQAYIRPVPSKLLDEVASAVQDPDVPKQFIEAKGRDEYNPMDPAYLRQLRAANRSRGIRITEALIMFGIDLVEPVPPSDEWLPRLLYMAKRGALNLDEFDFGDPLDREFVFKCYVAVAATDMMYVSRASGLTEPEVAVAMAGFPGKETRDTDTDDGPET